MSLKEYIKDTFLKILVFLISTIFILYLLFIFKMNSAAIVMIGMTFIFLFISIFVTDFVKKKIFYDRLWKKLNALDQKYLIGEVISSPSFLEGKILLDILYETNKSMLENIQKYQYSMNDFKEYLELLIHDMKIPLSSSLLSLHNHKGEVSKGVAEDLYRIENYVEQILYYARSETVEKDYFIRKESAEKLVKEVILRNKKTFICKKISIELHQLDLYIYTDPKWFTFILNQILSNSIKYIKKENGKIKIWAVENRNAIKLYIEDTGIGIEAKDLDRVFDKSFTGENGRLESEATGMGLYICKNLCTKLGHSISIASEKGKGTTVTLTFPKNSFTTFS